MKVVILAGGKGMRMGEDCCNNTPKPMIRIGGKPILWHIMKHYDVYDHKDFILCLGHRGDVIRDYFLDYKNKVGDVLVSTRSGAVVDRPVVPEDWFVRLAETGEETGTGGRIKRIEQYISGSGGDNFLATYGDSLSNVPINAVVNHHKKMGLPATMCVMHSAQRFGVAEVQNGKVVRFEEKPKQASDWINGGFYVFSREVFKWLDDGPLEYGPLGELARRGGLAGYEHLGCHRAMDTPRDVLALNEEWESGHAAWKTW